MSILLLKKDRKGSTISIKLDSGPSLQTKNKKLNPNIKIWPSLCHKSKNKQKK